MPIIGIDLGTTNSLAAVYKDGASRLVPNAFGEYLTPSVVSIDEDGEVLVGKAAKERLITHPERTAAAFKRAMGTGRTFSLAGREFLPEELSALVLRRLKEDAEAYLGQPVEEAVVSVPAYFTDSQRAATKRAGKLAGLRVERLINEPSAAALACYDPNQGDAAFLVYDFGGGTLDVSVVDCFENVVNILAVSGDNQLGGNDLDAAIAHMYCQENNIDYDALDPSLRAILLAQAEQCKQTLTTAPMAVMVLDLPGLVGSMSLTGQKLIENAATLFGRMRTPLQKALRDSGLAPRELHGVVPVGGSCKMPVVRQYLSHLLGRPLLDAGHPDTVVAQGAGLYAAMKERKAELRQMVLTDLCPFTLGVGVHNPADEDNLIMSPIIERNSALPTSKVEKYYTVSPGQTKLHIQIFQGEAMYCADNRKLGELDLPVPPGPAGQEGAAVRFTYDINGILEVEAESLSTGKAISAVLVGPGSGLSEAEAKKRLEQLQKLKIHPRDREENRLLLARGERLWKETLGEVREQVGRVMEAFQEELASQEPARILRARSRCKEMLDRLEAGSGLDEQNWDDFFDDENGEDEE